MRPFHSFATILLAAAVVLSTPHGATASVSPDGDGLPHALFTLSPPGLLVNSGLEVSVPATLSPSAELNLEEAMALCLNGDVPSCLGARLAVLAACGGTVLLIATPIPGDEVVVFIACNSAFMYWVEECVHKRYED